MTVRAAMADEHIVKKLSTLIKVNVSMHKEPKKFKLNKPKKSFVGEYCLDRVIGSGRCGNVFLAWHPQSVSPVAIKLVPRDADPCIVERLTRELEVLNQLEHPHIVRINEIVLDSRYFGIVMDWASGGDVFRQLADHGPIKLPTARRWFAQLVWAVDEMHSLSLVHRDIKPENLLIDEEENLILTDFEMCESFHSQGFPFMQSVCGSPTYCPPEAMLSKEPFDVCKADVWALGVTLYTMIAGYLPFDDSQYFGTSSAQIMELYRHIQETPLKCPRNFGPQLTDLFHGMLHKDPSKRFSIVDVKHHPWLEDQASLWNCPVLCDLTHKPLRTTRFGSLPSTSSLQTLSDKLTDCNKQVRGAIIWDPNAGLDLPRDQHL